jgi:hypothetical protein
MVMMMMMMMIREAKNKKESSKIIFEIELCTSFEGLRNSFNKPCHARTMLLHRKQLFVLRIMLLFYARKNKFYCNFLTFETKPVCSFISKGKKL